jgi:hypothetical protein
MASFEELQRLEKVYSYKNPLVKVETLGSIKVKDFNFPLVSIQIGTDDKTKPTFGLFAGVHGLEKIGTHVALHFLEVILEQLQWDEELQNRFQKTRLVAIPMVNPGGVYLGRRSNPNGVDIMRNAPVEADGNAPFMLSGQKYTKHLPWFRGDASEMETETKTVIKFVKDQMFESQFSFSLDIHSGFGVQDRLWYPYAKTTAPFPLLEEALKFKAHIDKSFPNHVYKIEPQAKNYTTHGDVWDYLFDMHFEKNRKEKIYIPWCLEMGSWIWIKKNPMQLFSSLGPFNPIKPHRYKRIMRRHFILLDFFLRSVMNYNKWSKI